MDLIPFHDATQAALFAGAGGLLIGGGVAGLAGVAGVLVTRRRGRADRDRLHRVGWALCHLADRFRDDLDGRWESGEIVPLLDNIADLGRAHPLDGLRFGWRARIDAVRLRRRRADGGAR